MSEKDNPFAAGVANLRETTKWLLAGVFGAAALLIGGVSFSDLGDLGDDGRLFGVVAALVVAAPLLGVLTFQAVQVLRSQVFSLPDFANGQTAELVAAFAKVSARAKALPGGALSLRDFADRFEALQGEAWDAATTRETALQVWDDYEDTRDHWLDACIATLIQARFETFTNTVSWAGPTILAAMLVFAIVAHPPEGARLIAAPYVEPLSDAQKQKLQAQGLPAPCLAPGARLLVVTAPKNGARTALLTPPPAAPNACVRKLTLSGDAILLGK